MSRDHAVGLVVIAYPKHSAECTSNTYSNCMMKKIVTPLVSVVVLITSQSVFGPVKGKNLMSSFSQCVQFKYHELQGSSGMDGEIRSIDISLTYDPRVE